jgi:hypothetical protein
MGWAFHMCIVGRVYLYALTFVYIPYPSPYPHQVAPEPKEMITM